MLPEAAMPVLSAAERDAIGRAFADPARVVVIALCAAWCDTCTQFRAAYERVAQARPQATFVWVDIEDDADVAGDVDVENFPTLAIYRNGQPLHFGVSLPHETTVGRLVDALADSGTPLSNAPEEVSALPLSFKPS